MKILVIGASGLIGNSMMHVLSQNREWEVFGTVRNGNIKRFFPLYIADRLLENVDVQSSDVLPRILDNVRPDVVVNCAGLTKHLPEAADPLVSIPINTLMPHRLAGLCKLIGARLIHISTDCVFSGEKGGYTEDDFADARDLYGKSKALGEVVYPHTITLRTSTIGHELQSRHGLLEWFLSQEGSCKGYTSVIFSGLPTVLFARVVRDVVIPRNGLFGLYHVAAKPISKFNLLKMIADVYGKSIEIIADDGLSIDRSLNADRFRDKTGFIAPEWNEMIKLMYSYKWVKADV